MFTGYFHNVMFFFCRNATDALPTFFASRRNARLLTNSSTLSSRDTAILNHIRNIALQQE